MNYEEGLGMDYQTLILNTKSVRDFKKDTVKNTDLKTIKDYANDCKRLVSSIALDVRIMSNSEVYLTLDGIAGYKGHMIDAPSYIVLLSDVADHYIENAGFVGQELILKATEIGVDSCWVTFEDSKAVKEKLNIVSDKEVVAVIALGFEQNKGKVGKATLNPAYRLGLDEFVYLNTWGNGADNTTLEERGILDAFAFARFAPSAWNKQPWRFLIDGGSVILAVKKDEEIYSYEEKIAAGVIMLFFQAIVDSTLFNLNWHLEKPVSAGVIPDDFEVIGYCNL